MNRYALAALVVLASCGFPESEEMLDLETQALSLRTNELKLKPTASSTSTSGGKKSHADAGSSTPSPSPSVSMIFSACSGCPGQTSFPIASTPSIVMASRWTGLAANSSHTERLDVYQPGGLLYTQITVAIWADASGVAQAESLLPILGTVIERYNQTGTWSANAALEGNILGSGSFDLQ